MLYSSIASKPVLYLKTGIWLLVKHNLYVLCACLFIVMLVFNWVYANFTKIIHFYNKIYLYRLCLYEML